MKYDILTGQEINEQYSVPYKKMCVNCCSCAYSSDDDLYVCSNEEILGKAKQKMIDGLPGGFEVETLVLKPMKIKSPQKKCSNYVCDYEAIKEALKPTLE